MIQKNKKTMIKEKGKEICQRVLDTNRFLRFDEIHFQKGYTIEEIKEALAEGGLQFVAVYDAFTRKAPKEESERLYFIAKEKYQEGKTYR